MKVNALYIYPVKSLGGMEINNMDLLQQGPSNDRIFMLVDDNGRFISQREFPVLSQFETYIGNGELKVVRKNDYIRLNLENLTGDTLSAKVWRQNIVGKYAGDEISNWFSSQLGASCRVVALKKEVPRVKKLNESPWKTPVSFADGYPYLIIGTQSLEELNKRLAHPVPMDRFRPNIVIETKIPHIEDSWDEINIGKSRFKVIKRCARCIMTTIDQSTGSMGIEPLKTLGTYRKFERKIMFGVNAILIAGEAINKGDKVEAN